jgi:hypothetical protein
MKKLLGVVLAAAFLGSMATGCTAYSGAAAVGDKVVIASNNGFLFGVFRKIYVCKVTDKGLTACSNNESP